MTDLSFNEEESLSYGRGGVRKPSFMAGLIIRLGIARDERRAAVVLGILAIVLIAVALFLGFLNRPATMATPSSEILRQARLPQHLP